MGSAGDGATQNLGGAAPHPAELWKQAAAPVGPGDSIKPERIVPEASDLVAFALLGFGLAPDPSLLPSLLFLHLNESLSPVPVPPLLFWKHITCLVSQIQGWREFSR